MRYRTLPPAPRTIRAIGFDDAPFMRGRRGDVAVAGVVCAGTRFEGLVWGRLRQDGWNATDALARLLVGGKFLPQLHLVLLDGLSFGGLNLVDLPALAVRLGRPCVAVMRRPPDLAAMERAIRTLPGAARRLALLGGAGPVHGLRPVHLPGRGARSPTPTPGALARLTDRGAVPEPLRLAHLVGARGPARRERPARLTLRPGSGGCARGTAARRLLQSTSPMCRLFGQHAHPGFDLSSRSAPRRTRCASSRTSTRTAGASGGTSDGAPVLRRGVLPAHADEAFVHAAAAARSTVVLAHVRDASVGRVCSENTHPFHHARWLFAHNGTVARYKRRRGCGRRSSRRSTPTSGPRCAARPTASGASSSSSRASAPARRSRRPRSRRCGGRSRRRSRRCVADRRRARGEPVHAQPPRLGRPAPRRVPPRQDPPRRAPTPGLATRSSSRASGSAPARGRRCRRAGSSARRTGCARCAARCRDGHSSPAIGKPRG